MLTLFYKRSMNNRIRESNPLAGKCSMLCARRVDKLRTYSMKKWESFINEFNGLFRDSDVIGKHGHDDRLYLHKVERRDGAFFCLSRFFLGFLYLAVAVTGYRSRIFTVRDEIVMGDRRIPDPQEGCRIELQSEQNHKRYRNEFFHLRHGYATNVRIL